MKYKYMGGLIKQIYRKKSGIVLKANGYTNSMPMFVKNVKFIKEDDDYISKYISNWDCDSTINPDCYGLVVFDFIKKEILSLQGYCNFNSISETEISLALKIDVFANNSSDDNLSRYNNLLDEKMASFYKRISNLKKYKVISDKKINYTIAEFKKRENKFGFINKIKKIKKEIYLKMNWEDFGWKVLYFNETSDGLIEMYKHMIDSGFNISNESNLLWRSYHSDNFCEEMSDREKNERNNFFLTYSRNRAIDNILKYL